VISLDRKEGITAKRSSIFSLGAVLKELGSDQVGGTFYDEHFETPFVKQSMAYYRVSYLFSNAYFCTFLLYYFLFINKLSRSRMPSFHRKEM